MQKLGWMENAPAPAVSNEAAAEMIGKCLGTIYDSLFEDARGGDDINLEVVDRLVEEWTPEKIGPIEDEISYLRSSGVTKAQLENNLYPSLYDRHNPKYYKKYIAEILLPIIEDAYNVATSSLKKRAWGAAPSTLPDQIYNTFLEAFQNPDISYSENAKVPLYEGTLGGMYKINAYADVFNGRAFPAITISATDANAPVKIKNLGKRCDKYGIGCATSLDGSEADISFDPKPIEAIQKEGNDTFIRDLKIIFQILERGRVPSSSKLSWMPDGSSVAASDLASQVYDSFLDFVQEQPAKIPAGRGTQSIFRKDNINGMWEIISRGEVLNYTEDSEADPTTRIKIVIFAINEGKKKVTRLRKALTAKGFKFATVLSTTYLEEVPSLSRTVLLGAGDPQLSQYLTDVFQSMMDIPIPSHKLSWMLPPPSGFSTDIANFHMFNGLVDILIFDITATPIYKSYKDAGSSREQATESAVEIIKTRLKDALEDCLENPFQIDVVVRVTFGEVGYVDFEAFHVNKELFYEKYPTQQHITELINNLIAK